MLKYIQVILAAYCFVHSVGMYVSGRRGMAIVIVACGIGNYLFAERRFRNEV